MSTSPDRGDAIFTALSAVVARYESFNRLGALAGEGGERALRGWLFGGFLATVLGWNWQRVVLGESLDVLTLDWRDHAVIYIETKTPENPLTLRHRMEMAGRAPRWGSLRHLFLTNGRSWERFDLGPDVEIDVQAPDAKYSLADGDRSCATFFESLDARRYTP
jgi:hypothetical protein